MLALRSRQKVCRVMQPQDSQLEYVLSLLAELWQTHAVCGQSQLGTDTEGEH